MYAGSFGCSTARCRSTSTREEVSTFGPELGGANRSPDAVLTRSTPCQVTSEIGDRRMLEHQIRRELQSKPIFQLDDQIDRVSRIETEPGELHIRIDVLVRQIESP